MKKRQWWQGRCGNDGGEGEVEEKSSSELLKGTQHFYFFSFVFHLIGFNTNDLGFY